MISLSRPEIEAIIDLPDAARAIEAAYRATSQGQVTLPPVGHLPFADSNADCHIKFGHLKGDPTFVIKVATGFPANREKGLPTGNGLLLVLSATTGEVVAILQDEMRLTDIRTGLGGAIASRLLARKDARRILVVGTGPQARQQIEAHHALLPGPVRFEIWGRQEERVDSLVSSLNSSCDIRAAADLETAVGEADILVTATGATRPLIRSDWIRPGTHITAVGADAPGKQELELSLVARADILAVDLPAQCLDHGEISHAARQKAIDADRLVELGHLLTGEQTGRTDEGQITIADLTGIAAQDIAIANSVLASWKAQQG